MSLRTRICLALASLALLTAVVGAVFSVGRAIVLLTSAALVLIGSWLLARVITRPLTDLQRHVAEVESNRDSLRRTMTRMGDTLSSTHDLERMRRLFVETAQAGVSARGCAMFLHSAGRSDLYLAESRGIEPALPLRLHVGEGVVGQVFSSGEAVHGCVGSQESMLRPATREPQAKQVLAVPLQVLGRVIGVIALYDRTDGRPFDSADLNMVQSFATHASVAADNAFFHQEAQRLSVTDGLTGLWNHRYLKFALNREIERSMRFNRPLAVLMLDLDRFKSVNDDYGHQCGDGVLIEVATRIKAEIREVDVLARYGGEEFVCVLPETEIEGALVVARRINDSIRSRDFAGDGKGAALPVTISIGVAVHPHHAANAAQLLRLADAALYEAKREGRDCVRVAAVGQRSGQLRLVEPAELEARGA